MASKWFAQKWCENYSLLGCLSHCLFCFLLKQLFRGHVFVQVWRGRSEATVKPGLPGAQAVKRTWVTTLFMACMHKISCRFSQEKSTKLLFELPILALAWSWGRILDFSAWVDRRQMTPWSDGGSNQQDFSLTHLLSHSTFNKRNQHTAGICSPTHSHTQH